MRLFGWFRRSRHVPADTASKALRGVNLGGWLVLEKWMTPELFKGLAAADEYSLCRTANDAVASMVTRHRNTFITRADFEWLAAHGVNAVRLPVGYWTFGAEAPYFKTIQYVDRAFGWAQATGIRILLDLHGAPGSQNGKDHSGQAGACLWPGDEHNIIKTLEVIKQLSARYSGHPALLGIELLNEPSASIPRRTLLRYYQSAYRIVRQACGDKVWIVFHDSFKPRRWQRQLKKADYPQVYIDTHQYQVYSWRDKRSDLAGHLRKTLQRVPRVLARMGRAHPVIIGEWSLALDGRSLAGLDSDGREAAIRAYGAAQLLTYGNTAAWFFWSYKTEQGGTWSLRDCIEKGRLPDFHKG